MSASCVWRSAVIRWRSLPTRRVSQTKNGSSPSAAKASRQSSGNIAVARGDHRGDVGDDRRRGRGDHALHAADVVGDPRLDLARAGAGEEGQGQALQVPVHRRAQVVHHALADLSWRAASGATPRAPVAIAIAIMPTTSSASRVVSWFGSRCRARRAAGTARPCRGPAENRDQREHRGQPAAVRPEQPEHAPAVSARHRRHLGSPGVQHATTVTRSSRSLSWRRSAASSGSSIVRSISAAAARALRSAFSPSSESFSR